jgi:hypothetical protein
VTEQFVTFSLVLLQVVAFITEAAQNILSLAADLALDVQEVQVLILNIIHMTDI